MNQRNWKRQKSKKEAGASCRSFSKEVWAQKMASGREILQACRLCPRRCGVNRLAGERGFCSQGDTPRISRFLPHFGEEPPLSGTRGAGTLFFCGCTMACLFCQNWQISCENQGHECSPLQLTHHFLRLQELGCHNLELVSPTPHIPFILEALEKALEKGFTLPVVYNTNSYISIEALSLLKGVVDIYLPDIKYAHNENALALSAAPEYLLSSREALKEMFRQVGTLALSPQTGVAVKGMLARILLLPGGEEGAEESLMYLAYTFPPSLPVSLMSQYLPLYRVAEHPSLKRTISEERKKEVIKKALQLGLVNLWIQGEGASRAYVPDFEKENPFTYPESGVSGAAPGDQAGPALS
jgi:putative pyruvate formate lyase activating enzyme